MHSEKILAEYERLQPVYQKIKEIVDGNVSELLKSNGIKVNSFESRIKTEKSLAGKLELKGMKYGSIYDITDIFGMRVITFFNDDVDKVAALLEKNFCIDWDNSTDKRHINDISTFGYMSLHFVCRIPQSMYFDENDPQINDIRFEVQIRTTLQHIWASVYHDMGYKSDVDIPKEYLRRITCLAGMLEIADREFLAFRNDVNNYRRNMRELIRNGKLDDIELNTDSFENYLKLAPFDGINKKIASINQAEIEQTGIMPYCEVLRMIGMETLGDVERMKNDYYVDAYNLARYQIGNTDYDIISSSVGISSLCQAYILRNGGGEKGLEKYFEVLYGKRDSNVNAAKRIFAIAQKINII